ncbi:MAG: asparagine synthase-related protein [Steroidobacteraceae bacterium]
MTFCRRDVTVNSAGSREVSGREWSLLVAKSMSDGPWYPTVEEHSDEVGYRFFAGRLTRRKASDALPSGFMLTHAAGDQWNFDESEPDGSWIALKFDRTQDQVSIASDMRVHQRWFYGHHEGAWYFSNSLVFLCQVAGGTFNIERRAIPYVLMFGHVPGRITPLTNVSTLLPGEVVSVSAGQMRHEWRTRLRVTRTITDQTEHDISPKVWNKSAEGILVHIREAVRDELVGIGEIVLPLSGGMDSRFLLGCALDFLPHDRIVTYTFGDPRTLDSQIARGLARRLGIKHVPVAMDRRPVDEICADGFEHTEGMAPVFPNSPLGPDRKALLKPRTYVLSGYNGDHAFGSRDVDDYDPGHNTGDFLFKMALKRASGSYEKEVLPLLASHRWDELGYEELIRATPGNTLAEKFERWHYEFHCTTRLHYHLFVFRTRAYYLTPFTHRSLWDYALTLPEAVRQRQRGYFMAMKLGYPNLYNYSTTRRMGLSANVQSRTVLRMRKAWRVGMNKLDDAIWKSTGLSVYFDPKQVYGHRRDLRQSQYHSAVAECIEYLKQTPAFEPKGLDALLFRYRKRLPVSTHILRALFTVREWERQYGSN